MGKDNGESNDFELEQDGTDIELRAMKILEALDDYNYSESDRIAFALLVLAQAVQNQVPQTDLPPISDSFDD